jgi:hypothetical protein
MNRRPILLLTLVVLCLFWLSEPQSLRAPLAGAAPPLASPAHAVSGTTNPLGFARSPTIITPTSPVTPQACDPRVKSCSDRCYSGYLRCIDRGPLYHDMCLAALERCYYQCYLAYCR